MKQVIETSLKQWKEEDERNKHANHKTGSGRTPALQRSPGRAINDRRIAIYPNRI
jgi:hypothetical protein